MAGCLGRDARARGRPDAPAAECFQGLRTSGSTAWPPVAGEGVAYLDSLEALASVEIFGPYDAATQIQRAAQDH